MEDPWVLEMTDIEQRVRKYRRRLKWFAVDGRTRLGRFDQSEILRARSVLSRLGAKPACPPFSELQDLYMRLCCGLNEAYTEVLRVPYFQGKVFQELRRITRLTIEKNVWIGPHNADIFIPGVAGAFDEKNNGFHGLVIEVDGKIHDFLPKMRKDFYKIDCLFESRIAVVSIENRDVWKRTVSDLIHGIAELRRLGSAAKRRVKRDLYLQTLLAFLSDAHCKKYFGFDFDIADQLFRKTTLKKGEIVYV